MSGSILVTGAGGFIGRHLVAALQSKGHTVATHSIEDGDIARDELSFSGIEHVFHLAGQSFVPESWRDPRRFCETNVLGAINVIRPAATAMKEGGGGAVVLIGSQSMFAPQMPQGGYAASKSALLSAMYYLCDELGPDNIRCNMVIPSWMWGPPVEMLMNWRSKNEGKTVEEALDDVVGKFPLRRMTEDGEVADVVAFFASDHAKAVTGQYLLVNSGEMFR